MSKPVDLTKLRTISSPRTAGAARVRDLDGRGKSFEIDHPDGRVAAVVRPATTKAKISLTEGRTE